MTEREAGDKKQAGRGIRVKYLLLVRIEPRSPNMKTGQDNNGPNFTLLNIQ